MTAVTTIDELKAAREAKPEEIIVTGELARKLNTAKKVTLLGTVAMGVLVATVGVATVTAPATRGLSFVAIAPVAALTGLEIATIIAVSAVGVALVLAVYKDYDEVSYDNGILTLKRKG